MRILVTVDDDPVLDSVLRALDWAVALHAWDEIVLLHVLPRAPLRLGQAESSVVHAAGEFLARVGERVSHLSPSVERVLARGEPAQEIARLAEERRADLVVMGALGEPLDFLLGSVSQKVVSIVNSDVLVVRRAEDRNPAPAPGFRALVAVDGSPGSEAGLDAFACKLQARRARIRLVHVVESVPALWRSHRAEDDLSASFARSAREVLARAKRLLERRGLEAECTWRHGSPAAQILTVAKEDVSDLIAVGSRGQSTIRDLVLGSITERVLRHAPCTVFCAKGGVPEWAERPAPFRSEDLEPGVGVA